MKNHGGTLIVRTFHDLYKPEIGHSWGELLSEKRWPNNDKFHFSKWSAAMFRSALSQGLIRRAPDQDDGNERAYVLAPAPEPEFDAFAADRAENARLDAFEDERDLANYRAEHGPEVDDPHSLDS